jgi:multimeric flavodoxin WrbA
MGLLGVCLGSVSVVSTLLLVHHTTSPATQELLEAALAGTRAEGIDAVSVEVRAALAATASDVLAADGFLLGTPANIGSMSGVLKVFLD